MDGIFHESQDFFEYCWLLLQEYSMLDKAQLFGVIKAHSPMIKRARRRIVDAICTRGRTRYLELDGRIYVTKHPQIKPTARYKAQIKCFWVLMQYIDKVDCHYAAKTFWGISMEIDGRDYDIVYVPKGAEKLCNSQKHRGGDTKYFVVVDDVSQISLIDPEKVHSYATVSEHGQVEYYSAE